MNIIAKGTKLAEILNFEGYVTSLGAFEKLIDQHKSTLRPFSISTEAEDSFSQSDVSKMAGKLLECSHLENICFYKVRGEFMENFAVMRYSFSITS